MRRLTLILLFGISSALTATEIKKIQTLILTPERESAPFVATHLLLDPETLQRKLILRVLIQLKEGTFAVRSRNRQEEDEEGRWQQSQVVPANPTTDRRPFLTHWQIPLSNLDLGDGPQRLQWQVLEQVGEAAPQELARSESIEVVSLGDGLYRVQKIKPPVPPEAQVEKKFSFDPNRKLAGPYAERDSEANKVVFFATNRTLHYGKKTAWDLPKGRTRDTEVLLSRFEPLANTYSEKRTLFGAVTVHLAALALNQPAITDAHPYFAVSAEDDPNQSKAKIPLVTAEDKNSFWNEVRKDTVLLYIHGYNNTFRTAVEVGAKLKQDLNWPGTVIAYSWATQGEGAKYLDDLTNADSSVEALANFILELRRNLPTQKLFVLSHSMGNHLFLSTLARLNSAGSLTPNLFERVVLAAPDVNETEFRKLGPLVVKASKAVNYYYSEHDFAVLISKGIRLGMWERAGRDMILVPGMAAIDATPVTKYFEGYGHNYFCTVEAAISDISYFLREGIAVEGREGITLRRAHQRDNATGWELIGPN